MRRRPVASLIATCAVSILLTATTSAGPLPKVPDRVPLTSGSLPRPLDPLPQAPGEDAAAEPQAEVLILGVYHMANPGSDVFNTEVDDVLSPRRQAEIAELIGVLKRFRPTKIAVEASFSNSATARRYAAYVAGEHELTRNETEQIGFRLARELGHETVYPVDVYGEFPFPRVVDYARANGRGDEWDALMQDLGSGAGAQQEFMASHSVLEILLRMNSDEAAARGVANYYRQARFSEPWNWAGPDLLAGWFHRNIRIYGNIVHLIDAPDDRVLAVYGAGHLGWLRDNVEKDPHLRLRKLAELVE